MPWTGAEQLRFFWQSAGIGFGIGFLLDVISVCGRMSSTRAGRFWWDALFGVPAALITFYGALGLMDGRLHPLLFVGSGIGLIAQHRSIGRWLETGLWHMMRWIRTVRRGLIAKAERREQVLADRFRTRFSARKTGAGNKNRRRLLFWQQK